MQIYISSDYIVRETIKQFIITYHHNERNLFNEIQIYR